MKFVDVKEEDVPTRTWSTRKIIREFMESGKRMVKLDMEDPEVKGRGLTSVYVSLKMALKGSDTPIKVIQSKGVIYLKRTDKDEKVDSGG